MRKPANRRPAPPTHHHKLTFVEGIRGVAALYVVLGHIASMSDPNVPLGMRSEAPGWLQSAMSPLWFGHLAVAAFIVVSGFCLQTALFTANDAKLKRVGRFFARRARRILPPYYACLAISIWAALNVTTLGLGEPFSQYLPVTSQNVLAHVFLVQNLDPSWMYKINGVLWTIAIEVQLYLLFPLAVRAMNKVGRTLVLAAAICIAALTIDRYAPAAKMYVWYLPLFIAGTVASNAAYRPNLKLGVLPGLGSVCAVATFVWCMVWTSGDPHSVRGLIWGDVLIGVSVAFVCYAGATRPIGVLSRLFSWRPLVAVGGFSYSVYLMHHPIIQALEIYRPAWVQGPAATMAYLLGIGLPVVLAGCWAFALVFELPFVASRSGKRRRVRRGLYEPAADGEPYLGATAVDHAAIEAQTLRTLDTYLSE